MNRPNKEDFKSKEPLSIGIHLNHDAYAKALEAYITHLESNSIIESAYVVIYEDENIVQLYSTEEKAKEGLKAFQKDHEHTTFSIDQVRIN